LTYFGKVGYGEYFRYRTASYWFLLIPIKLVSLKEISWSKWESPN